MMPGMQQMPVNLSYTPAPMQMMPGAPPAGMWQPGMPLVPTAPQGLQMPQQMQVPQQMQQMMPQPMPQQQFVSQMMPQAMQQPMTASAAYAQQTQSFIPFPMQQGAPIMETLKPQMVAAPQVMAAPQVVEQFVQTQAQAPAITYAAPAAVAAPQGFAQPAVTYAAPQATVVEAMPAQAYSQTVMNPFMGQMMAPPGQAVSYIPAPMQQQSSYIPAPAQMLAQPQVSSFIPQPQVASYIPAMQPQIIEQFAPQQFAPQVTYAAPQATVVETLAPGIAQTYGQQVSYIPAPAPVVEPAMPAGQSVIVEQAGDWLVCEDALGIFYHHTPTQQSFDNVPQEFLQLFPQGYNPPAPGAFAAAGYGGETVVQEMAYAPQIIGQPQVTYVNAAPTVMETMMPGAPQVMYGAPAMTTMAAPMVAQTMVAQPMMQQQYATMAQPMMQQQFATQMGAPMMAKVL